VSDLLAAADRVRGWRENPVAFVRENFGVEPDPKQTEALLKFARAQRLCLKACKGVGKTCVEAWCVWLFASTRPHANIAVISISGDNLQDGLWKELAKWHAKSAFLKKEFEVQKTRIVHKQHPNTWWISARQWSKSANAEQQANALAGLHADFTMFCIDEVGGIPLAVTATAEAALASGIESKLLMGGNPTHTEGPLYMACTAHAHLWEVVQITGDPDDPKRSNRMDITWARQQIEMYGREHPWVKVNVFGEFPPSSINALLGPNDVEDAKKRYGELKFHDFSWAQKRLGVDVARSLNGDRTVIFPRQGLMTLMPIEMRGKNSNEIAARVMLAKHNWASISKDGSEILTFVDDTGGWGHGTVDNLITSGHTVHAIQYHAPAIDPQYANRRAEMWMKMADAIKNRGMALPPDAPPELTGELTAPTYTHDVRGRFIMEDKDSVKERLQRSPDLADALALTFAIPDQPAYEAKRRSGSHDGRSNMQSDYDPLANDREREEAYS
jgi:phage terminase large subunit